MRTVQRRFGAFEVPHRESPLWKIRAWLRDHEDEGVHCPACGQMAKVYRRKINTGMVQSLTAMYQVGRTGWVHVPTQIGARSREEGKLAYWELVEEERVVRGDGGRAGYWRVTQAGVDFLFGRKTLPKYARVYDGQVLGFVGPSVTVQDALGTRFDYREFMSI